MSDSSSSHSHPQTDSQLILDDSDGEDDAGACIPCPFCYVDIVLSMLCSHLQEDHCFDLKCAVCDSLSDLYYRVCTQYQCLDAASNLSEVET